MAEYYRGEKNFKFKLNNLNEKEDFSIWKGYDQRNKDFLTPTGEIMKFPLKTGSVTDIEGKNHLVEDIKFMRTSDFKRLFPDFARKYSVIRQVMIGGDDYYVQFSKTTNDKLNEVIQTVQSMGKNPLEVLFEQTYDKNQAPAKMYGVRICNDQTIPQKPTPTVIANTPPVIDVSKATVVAPKISDWERQVLDAIRSGIAQKVDFETFKTICANNNVVDEERVKIMFDMYK